MDIPKNYQRLFAQAKKGKSKSAAIKAKCLDCSCFQKTEVTLCTVKTCSLWEYRPYQIKTEKIKSGRVLSDEEKNKIKERFKLAREKKKEL